MAQKVSVLVDAALSSYIRAVSETNCRPCRVVGNGIIEKGVRAELLEDHTPESVEAFMRVLVTDKACDFCLLKRKRDAEQKPLKSYRRKSPLG